MTTSINDLIAQKAAIDAQIAAAKPAAIQQVRDLMTALGVSLADLGASTAPYRSKRPIKYADGKGNTWTGTGQRPRWLRAALSAGASLDQFAVRKTT